MSYQTFLIRMHASDLTRGLRHGALSSVPRRRLARTPARFLLALTGDVTGSFQRISLVQGESASPRSEDRLPPIGVDKTSCQRQASVYSAGGLKPRFRNGRDGKERDEKGLIALQHRTSPGTTSRWSRPRELESRNFPPHRSDVCLQARVEPILVMGLSFISRCCTVEPRGGFPLARGPQQGLSQ
jgi:hypothetical protein